GAQPVAGRVGDVGPRVPSRGVRRRAHTVAHAPSVAGSGDDGRRDDGSPRHLLLRRGPPVSCATRPGRGAGPVRGSQDGGVHRSAQALLAALRAPGARPALAVGAVAALGAGAGLRPLTRRWPAAVLGSLLSSTATET